MTDYGNYISLKLAGDDAYLSEKMVGYPAELDEVTQRASKSRRKSGSVVLVMEYRSAGIHGA